MQIELLMAALSRPGYCEVTGYGQSDCSGGNPPVYKGYIRSKAAKLTLAGCKHSCLACERCNFVSFSSQERECSWFQFCDLGNLVTTPPHSPQFVTHRVREEQRPASELDIPLQATPTPDLALRAFSNRLATQRLSGKERPLLIAAIGTSVTAGEGPNRNLHSFAWPDVLPARLRASFPSGREVRVVKRAYPGTSSLLLRNCLHNLVPEDADLYIVEYTGLIDPQRTDKPHLAAIVNALRARRCGAAASAAACRHPPAIMVLAPVDQGCVRRLKGMGPSFRTLSM